MTPQERQLVNELFDRLARLEASPRDADAERVIAAGLARAPNALYPLVQTVLVQDEALRRADARIRELSGAEDRAADGGGFLDTMRNTLSGRGSVPSVRPQSTNTPDPRWNSGGAMAAAPPSPQSAPPSQGGSFLGTAAASAAGMIGGALLFNSIGSLFGHRSGNAFADVPPAASPWDHNAAGSDLARDAGADDIGRGSSNATHSAGLFGESDADMPEYDGDIGSDFGVGSDDA